MVAFYNESMVVKGSNVYIYIYIYVSMTNVLFTCATKWLQQISHFELLFHSFDWLYRYRYGYIHSSNHDNLIDLQWFTATPNGLEKW